MSAHVLITDRSVNVSDSPRAPADRIGSGIKEQLELSLQEERLFRDVLLWSRERKNDRERNRE